MRLTAVRHRALPHDGLDGSASAGIECAAIVPTRTEPIAAFSRTPKEPAFNLPCNRERCPTAGTVMLVTGRSCATGGRST